MVRLACRRRTARQTPLGFFMCAGTGIDTVIYYVLTAETAACIFYRLNELCRANTGVIRREITRAVALSDTQR